MTHQLLLIADGRKAMQLDEPRYNPRPPGVIREGSASHAILAYLDKRPARYVSNAELIRETGRSHSSISWSLVYLRSIGLIEAVSDGARNPRYNRYRLAKATTK